MAEKGKDKAEKGKDKVHGEGNYKASRDYNEATKQFVESGRVEEAARRAKPANPDEAREIKQAEQRGKGRAKGEDPALYSGPDEQPSTDEDSSRSSR